MIRKIWNRVWGIDCDEHNWEVVDRIEVERPFGFWETTRGTRYVQQCSKCGAMKSVEFRETLIVQTPGVD